MQQGVDDIRLMFARDVAAGRRMTEAAVLATEARMFAALRPKTGQRPAIEHKLADRMGTLADVVASIASGARSARNLSKGSDVTNEEHEAALAAARTEERARCAAIMGSPEAKGREAQALFFATSTSLSIADAKAALAAAPSAAPAIATGRRTLEEKAASGFGGFVEGPEATKLTTKEIWKKAAAEANRAIGVRE